MDAVTAWRHNNQSVSRAEEKLWLLQVFIIKQQCADLKDPKDLISINYSNEGSADSELQTFLLS